MTTENPPTYAEHHQGYIEIVLNRPERKNAVTGPLVEGLRQHLRDAVADSQVNAVLIRGAGGVLCSGLDLKEFSADPPPEWLPGFQASWKAFHQEVYHFPRPVVCALEKYAINAGSSLALSADFLVAGHDAFLHVGEVRMGRAAPMNLAWLQLKASRPAMIELAILGRRTPAARLAELGLVHSVSDGDALEDARALAGELAELPVETIAEMKAAMRRFDSATGLADPFSMAAQPPTV